MSTYRDRVLDLAPLFPQDKWRRDAACAGHPEPLWDQTVHGEDAEEREARHHKAAAICKRCPVAFECGKSVDWTLDEGVRAGVLLPIKKQAARPKSERGAA